MDEANTVTDWANIEAINKTLQEYVSDHGADIPEYVLKALSDLDHWVMASNDAMDHPWAIRVVGVQKFKRDENSPWPRTTSEAIYAPFTLDEAQHLANRFGNTNPDWRVSVQKVYDPTDVEGLADE